MDLKLAIQKSIFLLLLMGVGAAPLAGYSQQAPAPTVGQVTDVAPVTVTPGLGAAPGKTEISPQELRQAQTQAHDMAIAAERCLKDAPDPRLQMSWMFQPGPAEQLLRQAFEDNAKAHRALEVASSDADQKTQRVSAIRNSSNESDFEAAELARQGAVRTFLAARDQALESDRRVADLQREINNTIERNLGPNTMAKEISQKVEAKSKARTQTSGPGGLYVPPEFADLRLTEIAASQRVVEGKRIAHVTGAIINTRNKPIRIPPLWFAAVDRYGTPLQAEQTKPNSAARIPPGGRLPFSFDFDPAPARMDGVAVTFAPQEKLPRYLSGCTTESLGKRPVSGLNPANVRGTMPGMRNLR